MSKFHELFVYKNGELYHRDMSYKWKEIAGHKIQSGYYTVSVNGKNIRRHRVIWEMHHGNIPDGLVIDHINGVRGDDRIENLQVVTRSENHALGVYALYASNKSGVNGVRWYKPYSKWLASFSYKGKCIFVGYFENTHDAAKAIATKRAEVGAPESRRAKQ